MSDDATEIAIVRSALYSACQLLADTDQAQEEGKDIQYYIDKCMLWGQETTSP